MIEISCGLPILPIISDVLSVFTAPKNTLRFSPSFANACEMLNIAWGLPSSVIRAASLSTWSNSTFDATPITPKLWTVEATCRMRIHLIP
eukprot:CAMPEP_0184718908 /NCGR_PEP_ID=MMETSP0314-20130426/7969_1 /TAXON_ID=38298 /ORGANISM="Rhodella maculata, Strain CCMP 736" /LENGTH=89 /DNA_ID=CAMNT_0027182721 /DNA_START=456 /DNA_END=721 /DNA_ORIENTATION=-